MYYRGAIACSSSVWIWQWSSALHIPGSKNFVEVITGGSSSPKPDDEETLPVMEDVSVWSVSSPSIKGKDSSDEGTDES